MSPSKPVHPPISSEQSPPRSASACQRKRRCAPLLLLFLEKPLRGLFSDRMGLFAKSAPLCFRLSAKAPLRGLFSDRVGLFAKSAPLCFRLSAKAKERRGAAAPRFAWASLQNPPTMLPPAGGSTMRLVYCDYTTPCGRSILQFREIYVPVNLTASLTGVSFARSRTVL